MLLKPIILSYTCTSSRALFTRKPTHIFLFYVTFKPLKQDSVWLSLMFLSTKGKLISWNLRLHKKFLVKIVNWKQLKSSWTIPTISNILCQCCQIERKNFPENLKISPNFLWNSPNKFPSYKPVRNWFQTGSGPVPS